LVRIREQCIHDFAEARAGVTPVFLVELFGADVSGVSHGVTPGGNYTAAALSGDESSCKSFSLEAVKQ
jgi:hypothetical protein